MVLMLFDQWIGVILFMEGSSTECPALRDRGALNKTSTEELVVLCGFICFHQQVPVD